MRKGLFLIIVNLILVLLQVSFFGELVAPVYVPNIIFGLAFAFMFLDLTDLSYMSAFIGGFILDLLTFGIIGISSLTFVGSLFLFSVVRRYISKNAITNGMSVVTLQFINVWFILKFESVGVSRLLLSGFITLLSVYFFQFILKGFVDYLKRSGFKL